MIEENVDRRVLAGFRCVDAVSADLVNAVVDVVAPTLRIRRTVSGCYVVFDAPGFHPLTERFSDTANWPAATTFSIELRAQGNDYLPRRAQLLVPRGIAPRSDPQSVLLPQDVPLYLAPSARVQPNWAVVRVSLISAEAKPRGLPWAIVRVLRTSNQQVLATGMTDSRGEALLAVPGIIHAANVNGGGNVVEPTIDASVAASFDRTAPAGDRDFVPDPDALLARLASLQQSPSKTLTLARGTRESVQLSIAL